MGQRRVQFDPATQNHYRGNGQSFVSYGSRELNRQIQQRAREEQKRRVAYTKMYYEQKAKWVTQTRKIYGAFHGMTFPDFDTWLQLALPGSSRVNSRNRQLSVLGYIDETRTPRRPVLRSIGRLWRW